MHEGSITFSTALDNAQLEKDLVGLTKKIEKQERKVADLASKRDAAKKKSLFDMKELDAEKAKLQEIKNQLAEIRAVAKDKSYGAGAREEAKAQIPAVQEELKEQQTRVNALQADWNKTENAVARCGAQLVDAEAVLDRQKSEAGYLQQQIDEAAQQAGNMNFAAKTLERLKTELKELEDQGKWFGDEDYDRIYGELIRVTDAVKSYRKEVAQSAAYMREMSDSAGISDQRISDLGQELILLKGRLSELKKAGIGFGHKEFDDISARMEEINRELKEYKAGLLANHDDSYFEDLAESAQIADRHIVDLYQELDELKARQEELGRAGIGLGYQEYDDNAARISAITGELNKYQKTLTETGSTAEYTAKKTESAIKRLIAAMKEGNSAEMYELLGTAVNSVFQKISSGLGRVQKSASAVKQFGKAAVKAFTQAALAAVKLLDRVNVFPKMFSATGRSRKKLGQMIRRVFVFSVITAGLRAVRSQMSAYLTINTEFSSALGQLKGVLLTAFQPIYDVVVPALTVLMNLLARAIAAITQFTAVLFGTTAKQAQKNAQALYKQAKATSAAGSAAEEATGRLASFDEINKLQDESSGGGGGAGAGTGPLFDWEYGDTPFPDWGEAFDAFLDKILGNIPKLKDAFKDFADWINSHSKKLYDMFTFPVVLEKVEQLGRELAGAFNGLVAQIDWYQLGQAMGAGLNLALQLLTEFIYTFDWVALGMALAAMVNGLVSEVDWRDFGRLLWAGFKIGLETLAGFLLGLDMPQLARAAGNIVKGFFDEMKNTLQRIPWSEIGAQIAAFLDGIDWIGALSSVAAAIAAGLNAAIQMLGTLVATLDWAAIGVALGLALNKLFEDIDWGSAGKAFSDGLNGMLTLAINFLETTDWNAIGRDIVTFLENIDWLSLLLNLATVIGDAVWATIQIAISHTEGHVPEILVAIGLIVVAIALGIPSIIAGLGPVIIGAIVALVTLVIAKWDEIAAYFLEKIEECGGNVVLGLLKGIADAIVGIGTWLKEHLVDPIVNGVKDLFGIHSPSTVMAEIGAYLIEGLLQGISEMWHTITDFFGEKLDALKQSLSEAWENIKTAASEKWSAIKEALSTKWSEIQENAKTKFDEVKGKISEAWENTKTAASQKWDEIKSVLSAAWDNVKTSADEKFTKIKESIVDIMGKLKDHDWNGIGSTIMNGIWDGLKKVWETVTGWAKSAAEWLGNIFSGAKSAVSGIVSGAVAGVSAGMGRVAVQAMPQISTAQIPALASGAVIPPNREFMAVLGDQTSGNNLEAPESLIRKIVREEAGGNNTALLEAILEAIKAGHIIMVDRRVLGKTVTQEQNRATRQSGRSVVLG